MQVDIPLPCELSLVGPQLRFSLFFFSLLIFLSPSVNCFDRAAMGTVELGFPGPLQESSVAKAASLDTIGRPSVESPGKTNENPP